MKLLLLINKAEAAYVSRLKPMFGTAQVSVTTAVPENRFELQQMMDANKIDGAIVSNWEAAAAILGEKVKPPGVDGPGKTMFDYQGSCYVTNSGKRIVFINALQHLVSINYQSFITKRFIDKLVNPDIWYPQTEFIWTEVKDTAGFEAAKAYLESSLVVAVDIETGDGHAITEIGFCGIKDLTKEHGKYESCSFVISLGSMEAVHWMRELCLTSKPKIFHNGVYDNTHLLSWRTPVHNWLFDTLGCMHSTFPELPRDLAFTAAYWLRDVVFWKDEGKTQQYQDQLRYNARDVWATANTFLSWLLTGPEYSRANYALKFPELGPAVLAGLEGIRVDGAKRSSLSSAQGDIISTQLIAVQKMTWPTFNPNSVRDVKTLFQILGGKDATNTDVKAREKLAEKNPIASRIFGAIDAYKKASKLVGTYLNAPLYGERLLWAFNPFGTDSCRWSSSKSHLFLMDKSKYIHFGAQAQNLPPYAKKMLRSDEGFWLYEIDKKASESYCTALLSQCDALWEAVHNAPDFHCWNASLFFGIPFELLYDVVNHVVLQKDVRQLSKRVNHGANYCMGANVLVATMGEQKVWEAKALLIEAYTKTGNAKLLLDISNRMTAKDIAQFLLERFHEAYPELSKKWYPAIKREAAITGLLTSPSGWTRRCFGDPMKNKLDSNALIAHGPQHLSVMMLNRGIRKVFDELCGPNFRMHAQIHDSLLFSVRDGYEWMVNKVDEYLQTPITWKGKTLVIPNDVEPKKVYWK